MFGDRLKLLRKNKKLSQKKLGEKLGMAISTISGYEKGTRTPDLDKLKLIADFFNVSIDYLLERETQLNNAEKEFLEDIDRLSTAEIKDKYKMIIDSNDATDEEILGAIAWIKANRQLKK